MCGGTRKARHSRGAANGLSPRVRGNLLSAAILLLHSRSIPACAGEPRGDFYGNAWRKVYPRVCGEPIKVTVGEIKPEVYPRVCGGTALVIETTGGFIGLSRVCGGTTVQGPLSNACGGLSPRVRGNLQW